MKNVLSKKIAKVCDNKMLKIIPWPLKNFFNDPLSYLLGVLLGPRARKTEIMAINVKKFENN